MRILHLELRSCAECPYMEYEHPGDSWDGGHLCWHKERERTIIEYYELKNLERDHDGPIIGKDYIPQWCPLPEVG